MPAGTFRCFKGVKYDEHGVVLEVKWYSDEVKAYVKSVDRESDEVMELKSYSVQ